jgi:energy-coupling factor transporter ATP-binding protein EcfA2
MKILNIELIGYERFALNQIKRLYINFTEKVILILGTNGSGKSSLLRELSPLPAQSQAFTKDGSKTIEIEHNGYLYRLRSDFKTNKHSFLKFDHAQPIELNSGGTQTVQKELVKKEFGITPDLHQLFIGQIKFHKMTVADRRKWFTLFSRSDYTFALQVYQRFKDQLKAAQSNLKMIQSRLSVEKDKILTAEQQQEIKQIIDYLSEQVTNLQSIQKYYYDQTPNEQVIERHYAQMRQTSRSLIEQIINYRKKIQYENHPTDIVDERVFLHQKKIAEIQALIDLREKDLQNLQNIEFQLSKNSQTNVQGLKHQLNYLNEQYSKKVNQLSILKNTEISEFYFFRQDFSNIESALVELLSHMRADPNRQFTKQSFTEQKEKIQAAALQRQQLIDALQKVKIQLDQYKHFKEHNQTQCPKCQHVWIRQYSENDDIAAQKKYEYLLENLEKNKKHSEELENTLQNMVEFFEQHKLYLQLVHYHPRLKPLWSKIEESGYLFSDPGQIRTILSQFISELDCAEELEKIHKDRLELKQLIETIEKSLVDSQDDLKKKIIKMQEEIANFLKDQRSHRSQLEHFQTLKQTLKTIENQTQQVESALNVANQYRDQWLKQQMRMYIQSLIDLIESKKEKYTTTLLQTDRQKHTISVLESEEKSLSQKIESLTILAKELSPSEGLIAKGMMSFIQIFLIEINEILKQIWLYPLELVVEQIDESQETDLDYKFKLKINDNEDNIIPDIQDASSAMKEAIDLSFQIVCMKYLGMTEYPLFLDEFGHSMDSAHRLEATKKIHLLAEQGTFSQIFIISHFENSYGTFKNAQVNVLCKNNIIIPKDMRYNESMIIETA